MAGDEYVLTVRNNSNDEVVETINYGNMRYFQNQFSLENWRYRGDDRRYHMEYRKSDGRHQCHVWDKSIIDEIKLSGKDEPITLEEEDALADMKRAVELFDKYEEQDVHFVFEIRRDF